MRWCIAETCCVALVVAVAAAGCGSDPEPKPEPKPEPTRLQITVSATDDVNPDANGAPSPIVMRLYLLRGSSAFAAAEFSRFGARKRRCSPATWCRAKRW